MTTKTGQNLERIWATIRALMPRSTQWLPTQKPRSRRVASDSAFIDRIRGFGVPWAAIVKKLEDALPELLDERNQEAFKLVPRFLTETFGERNKAWETKKQQKKSGPGMTTWVFLK